MTSQQFLTADLLDIVFDNRNKNYGAYTLRRQYPATLTKAVVYAVLPVAAALCFIRPSGNTITSIKPSDSVVVRNYEIPEVPKPKVPLPRPLPTPAAMPAVNQVKYDTYKIVNREDIPPVATIDALSNAVVSNSTVAGPSTTDVFIAPPKPVVISGGGTDAPAAAPKEAVKPDRQPQFPGGMAAWADFLNRNLRTPEELEAGEKRTVNIRFHVDVDGSVAAFQIIKSGGASFDNEVIRVLKRMPKWSPALLAGQPVAISFTQPVTFVGVEE